jgi:hypothetical protein
MMKIDKNSRKTSYEGWPILWIMPGAGAIATPVMPERLFFFFPAKAMQTTY